MDYGFLIGQQFIANGDAFTVQGVSQMQAHVVIKGVCGDQARSFPAEYVMRSLITEEIELFQTGGIAL